MLRRHVQRNVTYAPDANYHRYDSFTFTVDDGSATSAAATVSITVDADNDAPVADDDSVSVTEDVANTITLAGTDADGDTLSFAIGTGPTHGSLGSLGTVGCSAGTCSANVTYTPDANYHRSDSFTFTVDDGSATSAPATVSITVSSVNDAPVADDDAYSTAEGQALSVDAPGVLVGDTDADGDQLSAAVETDPTHGTLVLQADGSFTYTPSGSFSGQDSFTYQASDGQAASNVATVTITVTDVTHAPVAQAQSVSATEDGSKIITLAGTDADGDTLSFAIGTGPTHGSLGSIGTVGCSAGTCSANVTYTPDANYRGSDPLHLHRGRRLRRPARRPPCRSPVASVNKTPSATVSLDSHTPGTEDILTATATSSDIDGDEVSLTYEWKVNGATVQTNPGSSSLADTLDLSVLGNGDSGGAGLGRGHPQTTVRWPARPSRTRRSWPPSGGVQPIAFRSASLGSNPRGSAVLSIARPAGVQFQRPPPGHGGRPPDHGGHPRGVDPPGPGHLLRRRADQGHVLAGGHRLRAGDLHLRPGLGQGGLGGHRGLLRGGPIQPHRRLAGPAERQSEQHHRALGERLRGRRHAGGPVRAERRHLNRSARPG